MAQRGIGRSSPERFAHGTAAQRARWFRRLERGDLDACDTYSAPGL